LNNGVPLKSEIWVFKVIFELFAAEECSDLEASLKVTENNIVR